MEISNVPVETVESLRKDLWVASNEAADRAGTAMEGLTVNRYRHEHAMIAMLEALRLEIRAASLR